MGFNGVTIEQHLAKKSIKSSTYGDRVVTGNPSIVRTGKKMKGKRAERCTCICGVQRFVRREHLLSGLSTGCGCRKVKNFIENVANKVKHGMEGTIFYRLYRSILSRCNNPNTDSYKRYGGRGIVCERDTFEDFYRDMYNERKERKQLMGSRLQIDRIDNNGNYSKSNCRFVDAKDNANNTSSNVVVEYEGKKYTLSQLSEYTGAKYGLLRDRIVKQKWSVHDAVTLPLYSCNYKQQ